MDSAFLERLLYEDESATLDFKREQYKFAKASEEEKSELIKDILGFANGWRRSDAYILIGVEEAIGCRSNVVGINDHLADHSLQQFVNNLTNKPVQFGYATVPIEGLQIGVIRVELQDRPIYLKKDFGKLKKGDVYVRRGSSTDPTKPATPDEIAQMGKAANALHDQAELSIEFAETKQAKPLGNLINWSAEYCEMPKRLSNNCYLSRWVERLPSLA
ncbi:Divergent AAA domain protein [Botrimarina colliarenosi]|uniref:Divergent AAA domain protein n=1 Tax=Botrimarina colliarenosi TaxID=2528001 RepID=A0A5C6AAC3_9BACT|nr:ATP-binding protein [Botrimarina colliarenosi]TWT95273.1 Divergent AAA domain protein [Botrimarina colliarenosi]